MFIDTHTHLYLPEFDNDRNACVRRALDAGVTVMLLPNIDLTSWDPMLELNSKFPENCLPMAGLHPTSVNPDTYRTELDLVEKQLASGNFCAIGEIGIDLYWDKTHQKEQEWAFLTQLRWAKELGLPVAIHMRNSFKEVWNVLEPELSDNLKGVFHCFSGNLEQAKRVINSGFFLGIGGVITFKNSGLQEVIRKVGTNHLLLETDAPYLAPVPYRGQRNEPAYIPLIASKIAEITGSPLQLIENVTTSNAINLFKLDNHIHESRV